MTASTVNINSVPVGQGCWPGPQTGRTHLGRSTPALYCAAPESECYLRLATAQAAAVPSLCDRGKMEIQVKYFLNGYDITVNLEEFKKIRNKIIYLAKFITLLSVKIVTTANMSNCLFVDKI